MAAKKRKLTPNADKPTPRHHVKRHISLARVPKAFAEEDEEDASGPIEMFMRSLPEQDRRLMLQLVVRQVMAGKNRAGRLTIARQVEMLCNTLVREAAR